MKLRTKQALFLILGVLAVTVIFSMSRFNTAKAGKENGKKFEDWTVNCTEANKEKNTPQICTLLQRIDLKKDDKTQTIALFQIGYIGPQKELKMIQTLPLGVRIEAGTSIVSSKKLVAPGRYTTCMQDGCTAIALISDTDLKSILKNEENSIVFMSADSQQISLPFSKKGLEKGLKYIK